MSSDASAIEIGVSDESVKTTGTDTKPRVQFDVERQILHQQIQELERELALERERRKQILTRYEQLLEQERTDGTESCGLLSGLF